jgi:hypothetical protein
MKLEDLDEVASVSLVDDDGPVLDRNWQIEAQRHAREARVARRSQSDCGRRQRLPSRPLGHARRRGTNLRSAGSRRSTTRSSARSGDSPGEPEPGDESRLISAVAHA